MSHKVLFPSLEICQWQFSSGVFVHFSLTQTEALLGDTEDTFS